MNRKHSLPQNEEYGNLTFKMLVGRFMKNSSTYGIFYFISQFGNFFIIPIYWAFLSPADYGIIGLTVVMQAILSPVIILGLHGSVERFYFEWKDNERSQKIGKLWLLSILVSLTIFTLIELTQGSYFPHIIKNVPFHPYFHLMLLTIFLNSFHFFPFNILRITERIKFFGMISVFTFFSNAIIIIFFLAILKLGVTGFLLGGMVNAAIWMIFWFIWMLKQVSFRVKNISLRREILYALPSLPMSFIDSIARNFDRYLLEKHLTLSQLGFYNLGNRFGSYFDKINSSMKTAWFPMTYKMKVQRKDFKKVLPSLSLVYFFILSIFALSVSLLLKEIIFLFGKTKFMQTYQYIPLFVLLYFIKSFATAWGRGLDLAYKPQYGLISTIAGVVVGIGLLLLMVPKHGTYGALIAMLAAALTRTVTFVALAHFFYPRKFLFKEVFILLSLAGLVFYIGFHLKIDHLIFSGLTKLALIVIYSLLGIFVVFGSRRVFNQLKAIKNRFFKRGSGIG